MSNLTPWLILIALGAFHGLNPAMGWFFAATLGLYRKSRRVVLWALIPIALGHAAAIGVVVFAVIGLGMAINAETFRMISGALLIAWGVYHWLYGHQHHFHIGVGTGFVALGVWSFLMATAHGAGMMLIPVLMPLEHAHHADHAGHMPVSGSFAVAALAVLVHSLAMLIVTGGVALGVYQWASLDLIKRRPFNLDVAWTIALIGMGLWLLLV